MSSQITVNDFKWIKGENDLEYIKLLQDALERQKEITSKAVAKVKELSAQNFPTQMSGTSDAVSRRMVLDALHEYMDNADYTVGYLHDVICNLPSVQPEIIHCENCEHCDISCDNECNQCYSCKISFDKNGFWKEVMNDDFCSKVERRADE